MRHRGRIPHVATLEIDVGFELRRAAARSVDLFDQAVQHPYPIAAPEQRPRQMPPDEAGTPRDKYEFRHQGASIQISCPGVRPAGRGHRRLATRRLPTACEGDAP